MGIHGASSRATTTHSASLDIDLLKDTAPVHSLAPMRSLVASIPCENSLAMFSHSIQKADATCAGLVYAHMPMRVMGESEDTAALAAPTCFITLPEDKYSDYAEDSSIIKHIRRAFIRTA